MVRCSFRLGTVLVLLLAGVVSAAPEVWILQGHPGDHDHEVLFGLRTGLLRHALTHRFGVADDACHLIAGEDLTRERLAAAIPDMDRASARAESVWLFVFGHANPTGKGANFNLDGPDVSARELGNMLRHVRGAAPLVVVFTTSTSGPFLAPLAGPGRMVITATLPAGEVNETRFPHEMVEALRAPETDADGDGTVSVLELFAAVRIRVQSYYESEELVQTEHALIDADGDGHGTQEPAGAEAEAAARVRLELKGMQE